MSEDNAERAAKPGTEDTILPRTPEDIAMVLARDMLANQRLLRACEHEATDTTSYLEVRFSAMDRATRLVRANTALAAMLLRGMDQARERAAAKPAPWDKPFEEKTWDDFRQEIAARTAAEKKRQTNTVPKVRAP